VKPGPHPRNRHRARYDLPALVRACPALEPLVRPNPLGEPTIDFADARAVRLLNQALLAVDYGIRDWDLPDGYLCPPIPGRADYLHHAADLLGGRRGPEVRVLDIGTGASGVYPLIGHREYGWSFVATDTDAGALANLARILQANPPLAGAIELRRQADPGRIFAGVAGPGERFDLCVCNPPFHASLAEAREGSRRKWRNLGRTPRGGAGAPVLNFGGQGAELWCPGGEAGFIARMAAESRERPGLCGWFSALVSRSENLPAVRAALRQAGAGEVRVVAMGQGQKESRFVAWRY